MEEKILVMKFGGTSVGTSQAMLQVVHIISEGHATWKSLVVVTSALSGVTDLLLQSAREAADGDIHKTDEVAYNLRSRHFTLIADLVTSALLQETTREKVNKLVEEFSQLCHAIAVLGEATPRALDAVASLGERMALPVLTAVLESAGIPAESVEATQLIVTDESFQSAVPDMAATRSCTRRVLCPLLEGGKVAVVTGFIAATPRGIVTTLGRGGSDYSAAILGAALPANDVWIWTDVDGVMTADPRLVSEARTIASLNYREIAEMSYFGAKVVHPKTIRPVIASGIPLRVCNTFNPQHPGTRIVGDEAILHDGVIKAVTASRGMRLITLEGRGLSGVVGISARTLSAVASAGISVILVSQASSEQSICFAVPSESAEDVIRILEAAFHADIARQDVDRVWATDEVGVISVVGAGMIHTPGVAGRVFSAMGAVGVNIIAIAQGSSEVSISFVTDASDIRKAVNTLHGLIVK